MSPIYFYFLYRRAAHPQRALAISSIDKKPHEKMQELQKIVVSLRDNRSRNTPKRDNLTRRIVEISSAPPMIRASIAASECSEINTRTDIYFHS